MIKPHGSKFSIRWLADELGIDYLTLRKRLAAAGVDTAGKKVAFTLAEALDAWTAKSEGEANRNRKAAAEAEKAEIETAKELGKFHLRDECKRATKERAIRTRVVIENFPGIPIDDKIGLSKAIAAVQFTDNGK